MADEKKVAAAAEPLNDDDAKTLDPRGVLTNGQYRKAQARARAKVEKERIAAAMDEAEKAEENRIKLAEGFLTGTISDELVEIEIDLVEDSRITVNGFAYWHGQKYTVPRHVANSLAETMYRLREYQAINIEGKKLREFYRAKRPASINGRTGAVH